MEPNHIPSGCAVRKDETKSLDTCSVRMNDYHLPEHVLYLFDSVSSRESSPFALRPMPKPSEGIRLISISLRTSPSRFGSAKERVDPYLLSRHAEEDTSSKALSSQRVKEHTQQEVTSSTSAPLSKASTRSAPLIARMLLEPRVRSDRTKSTDGLRPRDKDVLGVGESTR